MPRFRTHDHVELRYSDAGDGPAVVLVAGGTAPLITWKSLQTELLATGHRVIALDRRHAGDSDGPIHGMRLARQGADLHEFLQFLCLPSPVCVGSSLGVSCILAMIDLFGTAGIGGLVLVDQTPKMMNEAGWALGHYDLTWNSLEEFVATFGTDQQRISKRFFRFTTGLPAPESWLLMEARKRTLARPLLRDHALQDWRDVLPLIDVPTLAVGGRHSELWPVEHADYIASTVQNGTLLVLEHSGHTPMWTEPALFNAKLLRFISEIDRPISRRL